ncbi:MAG: hypothetical protein IIC75_02185 [Bacteroidetes bacterium]|nr:hypothetical protein [Bacteroidota bacterium]
MLRLNKLFVFIVLPLATIILQFCASTDCDREEILVFFKSDEVYEAAELEVEVMEGWDSLNFNAQAFTTEQAREYLAQLELKAIKAYDKLGEIYPPKCLRSVWDKEVEVAKLYAQAISLIITAYKSDNSAEQKQANDLIYKANDIKTKAMYELEDIFSKHNIDI